MTRPVPAGAPDAGAPDAGTADAGTADVVIVGAGGAGATVLLALDRLVHERGVRPPSVVVIDPVHRRGEDRTWSLWGTPADLADLAPLAYRTWRRLEVRDRAGVPKVLVPAPLVYVMLRSSDVYAAADAALARLGGTRLTAAVERVSDGATTAVVTAGGRRIRGRWVLDSRPAPPIRAARTTLLQHFRGWVVRFDNDAVDPGLPTFMDFSTPQPPAGLSFGYCLPFDARRVLVEYTEFTRDVLPEPGYDAALRRYLRDRWGVSAAQVTVEHVEHGVIPMDDAVRDGRPGHRVLRLGAAGGATRGSTGYAFAAMHRQAAAVAEALLAGRDPGPPPAYHRRHRWMDAVLLRGLDRGVVDGPDLFLRLFARNPADRLLRFLDGTSTPAEDLAVMATAPTVRMARLTAGDAAARVLRLPT